MSTVVNVLTLFQRRKDARKWVGEWEAYTLKEGYIDKPMAGAGIATVTMSPLLPLGRPPLMYECCDVNAHQKPTRHQRGTITIDQNNPTSAIRKGQYTDKPEIYEQRLTMTDDDTIIIIPVPGSSLHGDIYAKHAWKRKR